MRKWRYTINLSGIFHNHELTFEARRDAIVRQLRNSPWFKEKDDFDDLPGYLDELADTQDNEEFDDVWVAIYDEADADSVWIKTI